MSPYEQAKELRKTILPQLAARKNDLKRMVRIGPSSDADYRLLLSAVAFALAEVSIWEGENQSGNN